MAKLAVVGLGLWARRWRPGCWRPATTSPSGTGPPTRPGHWPTGRVGGVQPAEAAAGVEAAITMVTNPQALEQVVLGADGLAAALSPGQLLIDMSTVGPEAVGSVAARLPQG